MDPMNGGGACRRLAAQGEGARHHFQVVFVRGSEVAAAPDLHSGDPRTIHFPTDDEQAKWDAALHRRAYATDTSTIGRTTCSFRFRTRIVQDVVATFYQMKL